MSLSTSSKIDRINRVELEGNVIECGGILMIPSEEQPSFYKIDTIVIKKLDEMYIIGKKLLSVFRYEHTGCYYLQGEQYSWEIPTNYFSH